MGLGLAKPKGFFLAGFSLAILLLISFLRAAEISSPFSLPDIFGLGKTLLDTDGDSLADRLNLVIILADSPHPLEVAAASEISARMGFESLVPRFDLVRQEKEISDWSEIDYFILIGDNFRRLIQKVSKTNFVSPLKKDQGIVRVIYLNGRPGVHLRGGTPEALLSTARAFFNRFPYLWDIHGPESGETYDLVEKTVADFCQAVLSHPVQPSIKEISYEWPEMESPFGSLERLRYERGEIKEMVIEIDSIADEESSKLRDALELLKLDHRRGKRTDLLSFANCSRLTFVFAREKEKSISLDRVGLPRRLLTPGFRSPRPKAGPSRDFDLLDLFTSRGLYSDSNGDGVPDGLEGLVIIPRDKTIPGLHQLGLRIAMESAGLSFPLFYLDKQIEETGAFQAPIIIGENSLTEELRKTGKLKPLSLKPGQGKVIVVPQAFAQTNAVLILAADNEAMEKTLRYFSQTFPYLQNYGLGLTSWKEVRRDLENLFRGEKGASEAFFYAELEKILKEIKSREIEEIKAEIVLPQPNKAFREELESQLKSFFPGSKAEVKMSGLKESQVIFEKEKKFAWEGEEALRLLEEKLMELPAGIKKLQITLALSESPEMRRKIKEKIEARLRETSFSVEVKVLSSYKAGFFWVVEEIAPALKGQSLNRLLIRVAREKDDRTRLKRFYVDPNRWLQELYPVDEILARQLALPLEKIEFELKDEEEPVYEVIAYDPSNRPILNSSFSPVRKKITYWPVLPEWGEVTITPSWFRLESEGKVLTEIVFPSDLENFWTFYHQEVIPALHQYIMKKTGQQPTSAKQPYFKQLTLELEASEPDFRLVLDEEMISSLEAIHDEIYFDTLDYLRGITEIEVEEREEAADTSRLSAPGNIFPIIHPSKEGQPTRIRAKLEDWKTASPEATLTWKEKGHLESSSRRLNFPRFRPKFLRLLAFTWDGRSNLLEDGLFEVEMENEKDYLNLIRTLDYLQILEKKNLIEYGLAFPSLRQIILRVKYRDLSREISLPVKVKTETLLVEKGKGESLPTVPVEIISPEKCLELVKGLASVPILRAYIAGHSYEGRQVPVIEAFLPEAAHFCHPRLITFKPTLFASGRQHANEVSATTYLLMLAEKIAREEEWRSYLKKINLVLLPMENPDGASLAYELQKITPYHSLHAGRYSSLGVDIGSLVGRENPILPEARVRREIQERWRPDIYLNLHGYPSHEWVQPFSGYVPFLFRDYWIPKGWFAFYRSLRLPVFEPWSGVSPELLKFIVEEMKNLPHFSESSQKFYDRYYRWATRWSPHAAELELYEGVNIYAKRRSPQETRLTPRTQITYIEETPELMDETARDGWLNLLCEQGLAYMRSHLKFLSTKQSDICRLDEESGDRVRFQWIRRRPVK